MWQYQNTDELYHYGRLRYEMADIIFLVMNINIDHLNKKDCQRK